MDGDGGAGGAEVVAAPVGRHVHLGRLLAGAVVVAVLLAAAAVAAREGGGDRSAPRPEEPTTGAPAGSSAPASTTTGAPATTTSTAPPTTTTTAPSGPSDLTLAFGGDLLPHLPVDAQAAAYGERIGARYDFGPMLAPLGPVLQEADVAICHLEVPVAADQQRISGYPSFGAPAELVDAVAMVGYDGCSTASNHSLDQGRAGISATLDRMDQVGLGHAGTARTAEEGSATTTYDVDGVQVAHLSYAYDFNGYRIPDDAPFAADQIDPGRIRADATRAREQGAQLVVVSLHWGTEYQHEPSSYQREVASQLLPWPDIDAVIGHHAHVVQPIEVVGGTFVVWGLGNQLANQRQVPRSDGLTVVLRAERAEGDRYRVVEVRAVPTYVDTATFEVWPIVPTLADPATPAGLRAALEASYDRTAGVLAARPTPGVVLAPRP